MKRELVLIVIAFAVSNCGGGGGDAQARQYEILSSKDFSQGKPEALCEKAKEAAEAYLGEENSSKYDEWIAKANSDCALADSIKDFDEAAANADEAIGDLR